MKKEIVAAETKYFCDVHPDRECFSQVESVSWYGSTKFDMMQMELHLCDDCMVEFYTYMEQKYRVKPKDVIL
jgi:hypothetical protein